MSATSPLHARSTSGPGWALAVLAVWVAITVGGSALQAGGSGKSLDALANGGVMWALPAAIVFLVIAISARGQWPAMALTGPRPARSLALLWFPALFVATFGALALTGTLPATSVLVFAGLNTVMVGISEELAFRGVLWSDLRRRLPFWSGFALVSVLFGGVHVLNGFITGEWASAGVQAVNAAATGTAFLALRIRTRSLLVVMVLHCLWDFVLFLGAASAAAGAGAVIQPASPLQQLTGGAAIAVPMLAYALFLIRNARVRGSWRDDALPEQPPAATLSPADNPR